MKGLRRLLLAENGLLSSDQTGLWRQELKGGEGALEAVRRLGAVQIDPVAIVERSHHLTLFNRVRRYRPADLESLYPTKRLFEHFAHARCAMPVEWFGAFREKMAFWKSLHNGDDSALNEAMALAAEQIGQKGPLCSRLIQAETKLHGYWDLNEPRTKATAHALELLWEYGDVVVSSRQNEERWYDLTERWLEPSSFNGSLLDHYIQAMVVIDDGDLGFGWMRRPKAQRSEAIQTLVDTGRLEHLDGFWTTPERAEKARQLEEAKIEPIVTLLPPLDNLLWRRPRLKRLFEFDYTWEIYMPPAKRKFGAYGMPILEGERIIGQIDPKLDRSKSLLTINRIELRAPYSPMRLRRLEKAMAGFARFHNADLAPVPWP